MPDTALRFPPALTSLPLLHQGKTRDTFATPSPAFRLVVTTDRVSTHNIVHESTVPFKGQVLNELTIFWIQQVLEPLEIPHHLVAFGQEIYDYLPGSRRDYPADLPARSMVVRTLEMIPVEFIWRAYMCGSLYDKYYSKGEPNPYGIRLPEGLRLMSEFAEPIFTPTDKSETDDPLQADDVAEKYPGAVVLTGEVYARTREFARSRGIDILDTKLEVGALDGRVVVGDEIVTPDSSRNARRGDIRVGAKPPWLDKQFLRDEAERIWSGGEKRPLRFRPQVLAEATRIYLDLFSKITGKLPVEYREDFI